MLQTRIKTCLIRHGIVALALLVALPARGQDLLNLLDSLTLPEIRRQAVQGNANAQYLVGVMYNRGWGVPEDFAEAVSWYCKAAEQGNARSQFHLGEIYDYGRSVAHDGAEAAKWYRKAAEQGYAAAQFALGARYANGEGVKQNYISAYAWLNLAAANAVENAAKARDERHCHVKCSNLDLVISV